MKLGIIDLLVALIAIVILKKEIDIDFGEIINVFLVYVGIKYFVVLAINLLL